MLNVAFTVAACEQNVFSRVETAASATKARTDLWIVSHSRCFFSTKLQTCLFWQSTRDRFRYTVKTQNTHFLSRCWNNITHAAKLQHWSPEIAIFVNKMWISGGGKVTKFVCVKSNF